MNAQYPFRDRMTCPVDEDEKSVGFMEVSIRKYLIDIIPNKCQ